jgi:hypothetical protein
MSVYSPVYHAMISSPSPVAPQVASTGTESVTVSADKSGPQDESFFHHILDVINPLQHLPVVGTIYRAITGEHIGNIEKIAGDTLYGGLWGAVASVADVAFEALTGKSVEDTALSLFKGDSANVAVASAKVTAPSINTITSLPSADMPALPTETLVADNSSANLRGTLPASLDVTALTSALTAKGVDNETAGRALYAYRRSMGMNAPQPVFASVN